MSLSQTSQQDSPQTGKIHVQTDQISEVASNIQRVQEGPLPFEGIDIEKLSRSTYSYSFDKDFEKKSMKKAKHLVKKIGKIKRAEKRAFLLEKLQRIEGWLTPEQKEELQKNKEKHEIHLMMTQDLPHHHRHMMKHHHHGEEPHHLRHRRGHGHHHGHGHHGKHHRGHHGRRHRGHSSSRSSSSSSRSSSHDRHGKKHHKRQFNHEKFYEKLQKVMVLARGPAMGETNEGQQAETLESKFDQICISKESEQEKTNQHNVKCNGCGVENIMGVRYQCSECQNFNFCEGCEAVEEHPHVFLKMKTPEVHVNINKIYYAANLYKKKQKERPHRVFKAFKIFQKMTKAMKKGDMKKFNKCHDKFFGKFSEEAKRLLVGACEWRPASRQQIEEEWLKLKQKNFESKPAESIELDQDHIEKYVDEQLSKLSISD